MNEANMRITLAPDQQEAIRAACRILDMTEAAFFRQAILAKLATVPICRMALTTGEVSFQTGFVEIQASLREVGGPGVPQCDR